MLGGRITWHVDGLHYWAYFVAQSAAYRRVPVWRIWATKSLLSQLASRSTSSI